MDTLPGPVKSTRLAHGRPSHGSPSVAAMVLADSPARVHRCSNAASDLSSALGPPNGLAACPTGFAGRCLAFSASLQFQFREAGKYAVSGERLPGGEEHYRGTLGVAIGCDKAEIRSKYFADLGRMRQEYVDNRGIPATDTGHAKNPSNHKRYGFKLTGTPSAHAGASNSGSGTPSGLGQSLPSSGPWSLAPRDQATKH